MRLKFNVPILLMVIAGTAIIMATTLAVWPAKAAQDEVAPATQEIDNDSCLSCHGEPGKQTELPSGEMLYLSIDQETFEASIHGTKGVTCVQCHTDTTGYPHEPIAASTRRELTLELYTSCAQCHGDKYEATLDSTHNLALEAGNTEAAVCTDCHGSHDISPPESPRTNIPKTCERCHSEIYNRYRESVHGAALTDEGNPDVPTCIDCHGVHDVSGPSNSPFHLFSPQICAKCHADTELMESYDISTEVFDTYVSDFHGTTVTLFEVIAPDQETNKPVCIDCHGVHDMRKVNDPESTVIKENLLTTCQKCHPDATTNFPNSWLSHYVPSRENAPLVFYVNLFYKILIPTMIGGMLVFVLSDGTRRILKSRRERPNE